MTLGQRLSDDLYGKFTGYFVKNTTRTGYQQININIYYEHVSLFYNNIALLPQDPLIHYLMTSDDFLYNTNIKLIANENWSRLGIGYYDLLIYDKFFKLISTMG